VLGLELDRSVLAVGAVGAVDAPAATTADAGLSPAALALMVERAAARAARDYVTADRLRKQLSELGIDVVDRPASTSEARRIEG
jgi:cysteinyl-tRNA synthetase